MQITVTIPDEFASEVQARGFTPEYYVEQLIAAQARSGLSQTDIGGRLSDLESFFKELAAHSGKVPILPDEALTRESFYRDHD